MAGPSPQTKFSLVPVYVAFALVSVPVVMLAFASGSLRPQETGQLVGSLCFWTAAIGAYFTRKRPAGGFLFVFFFQLLFGVVAVIGTASEKFLPPPSHNSRFSAPTFEHGPWETSNQKKNGDENFEPRVSPTPNAYRPGLRILANVPFYLAYIVAIVFAWRAAARRDLTRLRELRRSYILLLGMSLFAAVVDGIVSRGSLAQSILVFVWTASWCGYLFWSHRIHWVFGGDEWDFSKFSARFDVIPLEKVAWIRKFSRLTIVAFGVILLALTLALIHNDKVELVGMGMVLAPFLLVIGMAVRAVSMRRALRMSGGDSVSEAKPRETEHMPGDPHENIKMDKNSRQRWVLMCAGTFTILAIMFPPYIIYAPNGITLNGGFSFLFSSDNALALVNTGLLGLEILAIGIVGAVAWLIAWD